MSNVTKFIFPSIPNTAQYKFADWSHLLSHAHSGEVTTLDEAKEKAKQNPQIVFFFNMRGGMYLEKHGNFASGDNVFFSGEPWLGSAPMADTYFVAEAYDLSDTSTTNWIKARLASIKLPGHSADSTGSAKKPVTGGFIFIDFPDVEGSKPVNESFDQLVSYTDSDGKRKTVKDWFKAESGNIFDINFVLHNNNADNSYVRMQENWSTYLNNPKLIEEKLQAPASEKGNALTIPNWDIVYIVLPEGASRRNLFISQEADCSWAGHDCEIVFLDSGVFAEEHDRDWAVVAHETLHALGLPDLYANNRSFGWSMMADCRVAWHLLGWEKLILGWTDLDDYVWVKRGLLNEQIHDMFSEKGNTKGVVLFDDTSSAAYVVEVAKPRGRTPAQRDAWNDHGLLFYRVEFRSGSGQILPLVHEWKTSDNGGAPLAPFPVPDVATAAPPLHKDIMLQPMEKGGNAPNNWIRAYVGRMGAWKIPESATVLRSDERIESKSGKYRFILNGDGQLEFQVKTDDHFVPMPWNPVPPAQLDKEYGFFCMVGREGRVTVSQGTGPENQGTQMWSNSKSLPTGHYFLYIRDTQNGCHLSVFSGTDPTDNNGRKQYDLFDYPDHISFDVKTLGTGAFVYSKNLKYRLQMQSDGNLALNQLEDKRCVWKWSAFTDASKLPKNSPVASFDADGRFQVRASDSSTPAWRYEGTVDDLAVGKPRDFFLNVADDGAITVYQGSGNNDPNKKKLYALNRS